MKIKMRYDTIYQTLEVDSEKMWISLSLEAGSNISQEEKEQLIQDKVEEIYNKPEYNSWHRKSAEQFVSGQGRNQRRRRYESGCRLRPCVRRVPELPPQQRRVSLRRQYPHGL